MGWSGSAHVSKRSAGPKGRPESPPRRALRKGKYEFRVYVSTKKKKVTASGDRELYA
jgi:hypothetical protein